MVYANAEPNSLRKKVRVSDILQLKGVRKISSLTCYDATFARLLSKTSLDFVLVGDSLGHVIQGRSTTIGVTAEEVAYHVKCVAAALKAPLLVADMPFGSVGFHDQRVFAEAELMLKAGAEAVKIEGASSQVLHQIEVLAKNGVPVMGHLGLTPQSVHALSGYKVQGKDDEAAQRLLKEAKALENAGVFAIVLELVTPQVSERLTRELKVPTIGIGSGLRCDGQILVLQDMLGMNTDFKPKFLRHFAKLEEVVLGAVSSYCEEVSVGGFPGE